MVLIGWSLPRKSAKVSRIRRRAAAAVELALLLPFLMSLVYGMAEFGRGLIVKENLSNAAENACRTGALPGKSTAQVQAEVDIIMEDAAITGYSTVILLNGNNVDIQNAGHNDQISVQVSVPVSQIYWTTTFFLSATAIESETVVMLRQG
jgi:Flp pilus assembly protein TadG